MEGVLELAITVRTVFGANTFLIFTVVWVVVRLIDLVFDRINVRLQQQEQTFANTLFRPMANMIKVSIILVGLVIWLDNIGLKVTTLLAGIGIGGAAIALAAQDPLKNLFASLTILMDKPFLIGDRIVVSGFDGVVEEIGLRSTRLRLLTGHQTSIPNQEITRLGVENIGRRPHIRRLNNIRLAYDTPPEKVERAIEIIKKELENHEGLHPDFPPRVYFNDLNDDSLNILMIYWYHPANYWDYIAFNNRVNLSIMRSFELEGITLAPPTMTALLKQSASGTPGFANDESPGSQEEENPGGKKRRHR
jgi:MscS family membrane protein